MSEKKKKLARKSSDNFAGKYRAYFLDSAKSTSDNSESHELKLIFEDEIYRDNISVFLISEAIYINQVLQFINQIECDQ